MSGEKSAAICSGVCPSVTSEAMCDSMRLARASVAEKVGFILLTAWLSSPLLVAGYRHHLLLSS
jgi:hypothetical protein